MRCGRASNRPADRIMKADRRLHFCGVIESTALSKMLLRYCSPDDLAEAGHEIELTNLQQPNLAGLRISRELRDFGKIGEVPVILMSAKT